MTTTDPFIKAAEAEAMRAYRDTGMPRYILAVHMAEWARAHLAAQEPTDAEVPESVANLIRDLTDPDDCWFDHSGGCQAHGYLALTPEQECPHSEAKRLLAAHSRPTRRGEARWLT